MVKFKLTQLISETLNTALSETHLSKQRSFNINFPQDFFIDLVQNDLCDTFGAINKGRVNSVYKKNHDSMDEVSTNFSLALTWSLYFIRKYKS